MRAKITVPGPGEVVGLRAAIANFATAIDIRSMTIDDFTVFHRPDGPKSKGTKFSISHFVATTHEYAGKKWVRDMKRKYETNVDVAPRRGSKGYINLQTHLGNLDAKKVDGSSEDRFAMALRNAAKDDGKHLIFPGLGTFEILEYQMPFNARRGDVDVRAADLFGLVRGDKPCVVELKMDKSLTTDQDSPLYAILQGLTYCSLIQANGEDIAKEAGLTAEQGKQWRASPPTLVVMAPSKYWSGYEKHRKAVGWSTAIGRFVGSLQRELDLDVHLIALDCERDKDGGTFKLEGGIRPRLVGRCRCTSVPKAQGGGVKF